MQIWQKISMACVLVGVAIFTAPETGSAQEQSQYQAPPPPRPLNPAYGTSEAPAKVKQAKSADKPGIDAPVTETQGPAHPTGPFRAGAAPRGPRSGYYIGMFAGASVSQGASSLKVNEEDSNVGSNLNPMGGFKLGYTWPFSDEAIDQFESELGGERLKLSGSLELEGFYTRSTTHVQTSTTSGNLQMDMGFVMANALLRGGVGKWQLYAGPGVGGVLAGTSDTHGVGDTNVSYAYQIIGGVDYFVHPDWSIFAEYKYLVVPDFNFGSQSSVSFHDYDQNLVMLGLRRHF